MQVFSLTASLGLSAIVSLSGCRLGYESSELASIDDAELKVTAPLRSEPPAPKSTAPDGDRPNSDSGAATPDSDASADRQSSDSGSVSPINDSGGAKPISDAGTDTPMEGTGSDAAPEGTGPVATGGFSTPELVTALDSEFSTDDPSFTGDLLELYFGTRRSQTGFEEVWRSTRAQTSAPWGAPSIVPELSDEASVGMPGVTSDGLSLYFVRGDKSDKPGYDIYVVTRAQRGDAWGTPELVGASSTAADYSPSATSSGTLITFASNNELLWSSRLDESSPWSAPTLIPVVNGPDDDASPWLSDNGRFLVFVSRRLKSAGDELFLSEQVSPNTWTEPVRLTGLSSISNEADPWLSQDLSYVMFASNRDGVSRLYEAFR